MQNRIQELASAAGSQLQFAIARTLFATSYWQRSLHGPAPDRILVHPRDYYPKSLIEAELMLMGRFRLPGGEAVARDGSPFFIQVSGELWAESLHGFHWLRHFDAGGSEPFHDHLRQLVAHWVRNYGEWNDVAWRPHVTARRLMTWASFGRLILTNSDVLFRSRVLLSMARQARHLSKTAKLAPIGYPRLLAAVGLAQSGVFLPDGEVRLQKGLHLLAEELSGQILPDGGHVSRNPEILLEIASDLFSVVDGMVQRELIIPVTIRRALDRMMPMIRSLQHADGRMAVFHGGSEGPAGWAEAILSMDNGKSRSTIQGSQSGYQRVSCGTSLLIMDCGKPPPSEFSQRAHAGALALELSSGGDRIIVNCGSSLSKGAEWQHAMRATAAHSTVTVQDSSSARVVEGRFASAILGQRLARGPSMVEGRRKESEDGILLEYRHDGYQRDFGAIHERRVFMSHDGGDVRGEDRIAMLSGGIVPSIAARFHLHPSIKLMRAGQGVVLTLPSGATWRFSADAALEVVESVYIASANQIRKSHQIVLSTSPSTGSDQVKWALKRATGHDGNVPAS